MTIIPPNTAQWVAARVGVLTASRMADAMPSKRDGKPTTAMETLAYRILAERRNGRADETFVSAAMQWGLDNEAAAIDTYENATGRLCKTAGLVMHPSIEGFAATPDRFVIGGGLVEVKCPTTPVHLRYTLAGTLPEEYAPQVWAQLACTGEPWCDFVSYDPRPTNETDRLSVVRVMRDEAEVAKVEQAAVTFLLYVASLEARLNLRQ
jgi:exodeoxyribonuclease (lambda-induced)